MLGICHSMSGFCKQGCHLKVFVEIDDYLYHMFISINIPLP